MIGIYEKTPGIYAIHSAINGRSYIGHSANIIKRWGAHRSDLRRNVHRNSHLQRAWNLYGEDAFEFTTLEECPIELLIEREQYWFNQFEDKYNLAPISKSNLGYRHTSEARANMSAAMMGNKNSLGRVQSPETRARMSAAQTGNQKFLGHIHSPETRAKMSETAMGHVVTNETREKLRHANLGRKHTEESKAKIGAASMGHEVSTETRSKIGAAHIGNTYFAGRKHTHETKAKISVAAKDRWADPEFHAKMCEVAKDREEHKRAKKMNDTSTLPLTQ